MNEQKPAGHLIFVVLLLSKGLLGLIQILAAIGILMGSAQQIPKLAAWLVKSELAENPNDFIASKIMSLASNLPGTDMTFYAIYFTVHGVMHIMIVGALLAGLMWAYPVSIAALVALIIYQMYEWSQVGGVMLLFLTALDIVVILLTLQEWKYRKQLDLDVRNSDVKTSV